MESSSLTETTCLKVFEAAAVMRCALFWVFDGEGVEEDMPLDLKSALWYHVRNRETPLMSLRKLEFVRGERRERERGERREILTESNRIVLREKCYWIQWVYRYI